MRWLAPTSVIGLAAAVGAVIIWKTDIPAVVVITGLIAGALIILWDAVAER